MKYLTILLLLSVCTLCALKDVLFLWFSKPPLTKLPSLSKLEDKHQETLFSIFTEVLYPKLLKILQDCVKEMMLLESMQEVLSTESSPISWFREEISQEEMELEENQFLVKDSMMKTLSSSTNLSAFQWPTQVPTQMEVNSLSLLLTQVGSTADM